jgi:hypothetical protein
MRDERDERIEGGEGGIERETKKSAVAESGQKVDLRQNLSTHENLSFYLSKTHNPQNRQNGHKNTYSRLNTCMQ